MNGFQNFILPGERQQLVKLFPANFLIDEHEHRAAKPVFLASGPEQVQAFRRLMGLQPFSQLGRSDAVALPGSEYGQAFHKPVEPLGLTEIRTRVVLAMENMGHFVRDESGGSETVFPVVFAGRGFPDFG